MLGRKRQIQRQLAHYKRVAATPLVITLDGIPVIQADMEQLYLIAKFRNSVITEFLGGRELVIKIGKAPE
jgi:hypothetical protein